MSMILDALRKSEAERRRAQAPDLFAEPMVVAQPRAARAPRWLWPVLGVVAALLAAWLARGLLSPSDGADPRPTQRAERPAEIRERLPMPASTPTRVAGMDAPAPTGSPSREPVATAPTDAPAPPASPAPQPTPTLVAPIATAVPPRPVPVPAAEPPLAEPTALPPAPAAVPAADAPGTLRLSDLSAGERRQLPPLKISMHMWASAPAQRFVIIDGARSGEGDRVGDAVIEEITEDGVLIAWSGRRLKLTVR